MHIENKDVIDHPQSEVYPLVRDEMQKVVPYLPNIERIDVLSANRVSPTEMHMTNHWHPKLEIPGIVKKLVNPELFSWHDEAVWRDDQGLVEYKIFGQLARDAYTCRGINYFTSIEGGARTELKVTFDLTIYPDKIPGVPRFLGSKVLPVIEGLIRSTLEPNLTSLAKGLKGYFAAQQK
jgi:hypothetical protein